MDGDIQAQGTSESKGIFVQDRRVPSFVARQVEADHPVADEAAGDLGQGQVLRRWHIAQGGHDDATLEPEVPAPPGPSAQDGADHVSERQALLHVQPWPITNLRITNAVPVQVFAELVRCALERWDGL